MLKVVAQVRRELEKNKTKRNKRGRPTTKEDKAVIRKNERIQGSVDDFEEVGIADGGSKFAFPERQATPVDVECRGMRQPAFSQDAKDDL